MQHAYIRVVGIDEETEGARGDAHFTDAEHTEFKTFAHRPFKEVIKDLRESNRSGDLRERRRQGCGGVSTLFWHAKTASRRYGATR